VQISESPYSKNSTIEFRNILKKIEKKEDLEENISNKIYLKYINQKIA
jgi:hypothetical protein